jgi:hypothetical protein
MFLLREAKLKTLFLLIVLSALTYSQTNFNVKWESPADRNFYGFNNWERNNNIPEIILTDLNRTTLYIHDGSTKALKHSYSNPDTSAIYSDIWPVNLSIDVNNDGMNEMILIKNNYNPYNSTIKVIDASNGQVMYQNSYQGATIYSYCFDLDGDSYIEILLAVQEQTSPYHSKLIVLSTASHPISIDPESKTAVKYNLGQNYPNPFNPTTTISYSISKDANVKMNMYNEIGELLGTYINEKQPAGEHKFVYDGTNVASGVYFYQLIVDDQPQTKKMVVVK